MRAWGALRIVALAVTAAGCGSNAGSTVILSMSPAAGVQSITQIRLMLSNAGSHSLLEFPASQPIAFPASLAIALPPSRSGTLDIAIDALAGSGAVVANGSAEAVIVAGGTTNTSALLEAEPSLCGNGRIDPGETCDDGNRFSGDGCSFECQLERATDGGAPDGSSDQVAQDEASDMTSDASGDGTSAGDADASSGEPLPLPTDFIDAGAGGYKLGAAIAASASSSPSGLQPGPLGCQELAGIVRDFRGCKEMPSHPDFEDYAGAGPSTGLVGLVLGADSKPVYASKCESGTMMCGGVGNGLDPTACPYGAQTTSKALYDQWYRTTDGVNLAYVLYFWLGPSATGGWALQSPAFFPLDGQGFGLSGVGEDGLVHDFGFTVELHVNFQYRGGEHFTFTGDDDAWVFVNGKLAIDLGGLKSSGTGMVDFDHMATALGLVRGTVYPLDVFHAERHTIGSSFNIDTDVFFTGCGMLVP